MPTYDYFCAATGQIHEVAHSWNTRLETWGEVRGALGLPPGGAPDAAPVVRLVGMPTVLRERFLAEADGAGQSPGAAPADPQEQHAAGCPCCSPPLTPGVAAFRQKLQKLLEKKKP